MSNSETSLQLPSNSDDFAVVGGTWVTATDISSGHDIIVDEFPAIAKAGYIYKVGNDRKICQLPQSNIRIVSATATWINSGNNEQLYNDLGLGYNGYAWETNLRTTPILGSVDLTPIYTNSPSADSSSYGTTHYIWNHVEAVTDLPSEQSSWPRVQVSSLPTTRNLCDSNVVYQVTGQSDCFWLNTAIRVCKMKPVYSMVALSNPPEVYNSLHTYSKGDKVISINEVYESLIDNNSGNSVSDITKWKRLGDIYNANTLGYAYYKVDRLPYNVNSSDVYTGTSVPPASASSRKYAKLTGFGGKILYYRKGYNFLVTTPTSTDNIDDYGLYTYNTSTSVYTIKDGRFFNIICQIFIIEAKIGRASCRERV